MFETSKAPERGESQGRVGTDESMNHYFVGLDLGQVRDFTAVAVLERVELVGEFDPVMYAKRKYAALRLRFLRRFPLGMTYPEMVEQVRQIMRSKDLLGRSQLAVDATGVGAPVMDLLKDAGLGCTLQPVMITGSEMERSEGGKYFVPKRDLITGVQVLLQSGGLQIAAGLEYGAMLAAEMAEMRVKITPAGNTQYGVWREGVHDDLVLAVTLACWSAKKAYPRMPYGDESWWRRKDQGEWEREFRQTSLLSQK